VAGISPLFSGFFAGQFDRAIECAEAWLRLGPRGRFGQVFNVIGAALRFRRRFEEALPKLLLAIQDDPSFPDVLSLSSGLLFPYGSARRGPRGGGPVALDHSAGGVRRRLLSRPGHREFYLSGLRIAAGEAG
jgi:hypothetical protein